MSKAKARITGRRYAQGSVAIGLLSLAMPVMAGSIYQAAIVANPQMQMKEGQVNGCGFQLRAIPVDAVASPVPPVMLDVSFNVYAATFGLMKGGAERVNLASVQKGTNLPIKSFWLKPKDKPATVPINAKTIPAETKGYLLYGVDYKVALALFDAVLSDTQVMLGVHIAGEPVERIYAGVAKASPEEKSQILGCLGELTKAMEESLK